ncbi:MAG: hypothetical protein JWN32_1255 [Solirubrobacterales bacterium]|nr:hypothetical protein [Solirubrobacterales bacterium]
MASDPSRLPGQPDSGERSPAQRRERARVIAMAIVGGIGVAFALVNLGDVKVNWIVGSARSPLILVIVVCVLLGALLDRFVVSRQRKRKQISSGP